MADNTAIREELNRLLAELLGKGLSSAWIGLELMTLGIELLNRIIGSRQMAEHLKGIAKQLERRNEPGDTSYSAHG